MSTNWQKTLDILLSLTETEIKEHQISSINLILSAKELNIIEILENLSDIVKDNRYGTLDEMRIALGDIGEQLEDILANT